MLIVLARSSLKSSTGGRVGSLIGKLERAKPTSVLVSHFGITSTPLSLG
jgi:hypothetical protein